MKGEINIAVDLAPKDWTKFKRWQKAACSLDNLSAEERWIELGNKPYVSRKNKPVKEKE